MVSESKRVQSIVDIFAKKGIKNIVFSPGSRNAPLIISFSNDNRFNCMSIVDERSASFFALGIAIETKQPVAICCTSGSATLNYASAISEAFYQKIPLIAVTSDRPPEWINHGEGQSINQTKVFSNYIYSDYNIPIGETDEDIKYCQRQINEALIDSIENNMPVHINIPFREPLYGNVQNASIKTKNIEKINVTKTLSEETTENLANKINNSKKVLVICGQMNKNEKLNYILEEISNLPNIVIITESIANLSGSNFIPCIDRVLSTFEDNYIYTPEILISIGGAVISKKIKHFFRNAEKIEHWSIKESGEIEDTYLHLNKVIPTETYYFFKKIKPYILTSNIDSNYKNIWYAKYIISRTNHDNFLRKAKWSDLKVFDIIYNTLPENCNLHLGNSSPVRYMQLFNQIKSVKYYSNRGVSGIDGSTSTMAGISYANEKINILISGDLSFVYDTNALWNNYIDSNFKIIVINNGGGGIFRIIKGPETTKSLETFFETENKTSIYNLSKAHNINYYKATNEIELEKNIYSFFDKQENKRPAIIEIVTPREENSIELEKYFRYIKNGKKN